MRRFLLLIFFLIYHGYVIAQDVVPLKNELHKIEGRFGVTFSYADQLINRLNVNLTDTTSSLEVILNTLSIQTGVDFEITDGDNILISTPERNYCALVLDSESNTPLVGAQLSINGKLTNILSDQYGYLRFTGKQTFQDSLLINYFGYNNKSVLAGRLVDSCAELGLTLSTTTLNELVITHYLTKGFYNSKNDHSLKIKAENLALLPGETDNDILLAIKTLPGITSPDGKAGNLHFRGSTTDQTLVLFDNIPIYHKGHYYGAISPYNAQIIDEVTVYRSGFGPNLGGRIGGAIELKTRKTIPDSTLYDVGVNSYYVAAFAQVPIGDKFSISGSIRSSYPGDWQSPKLKAINKLVFQPSILSRAKENPDQNILDDHFDFRDANLNTNWKFRNGSLSMSFLDISNLQESEIERISQNSITHFSTKLKNNGVNIEWLHYWSKGFSSIFSGTYADYDYHSFVKENPDSQPPFTPNEFRTGIEDFYLNFENTLELNKEKENQLTFGYQLNRHDVSNSSFSDRPGSPVRSMSSNKEGFLHALFLNHQALVGSKLNINAGLRGSYYSLTEKFRIEPRIFLNYEIVKHLSLKSSGGLYSQYMTQSVFFDFEDTKVENLIWELASDQKPVIVSKQFMIGSLWQPTTFLLDLEIYYKNIDDLSTFVAGTTPQDPDKYITGGLDVYGLDFLIRKSWGDIDAWINYSYTQTEMNFPELNQLIFKTYYDQPHAINIGTTFPWRHWKFSLGWQYLSGVPVYTNSTFFPAPGSQTEPDPSQIPSEENEGRFDGQHQLDLAIVYQFPNRTKSWSGTIGLSLLNLYDQKNLVAENYITFGPTTSLEKRYSIGFAPNIMLSIKW